MSYCQGCANLESQLEALKVKDQARTKAETDWGFQEQARQDRIVLKIQSLESKLSQTKAELAESEKVRWVLVNQRDAWEQKAEHIIQIIGKPVMSYEPKIAIAEYRAMIEEALAEFREGTEGK